MAATRSNETESQREQRRAADRDRQDRHRDGMSESQREQSRVADRARHPADRSNATEEAGSPVLHLARREEFANQDLI